MSFQEDVHEIILQVLKDCGGNKAEAARRLGTNPVTFWLWVSKERQPIREAISHAIDSSGARLSWPGQEIEKRTKSTETSERDTEDYGSRITELECLLKKSEEGRQNLIGEVKALERQLARLVPSPATQPHQNQPFAETNPLIQEEEEQPLSVLKTANE